MPDWQVYTADAKSSRSFKGPFVHVARSEIGSKFWPGNVVVSAIDALPLVRFFDGRAGVDVRLFRSTDFHSVS